MCSEIPRYKSGQKRPIGWSYSQLSTNVDFLDDTKIRRRGQNGVDVSIGKIGHSSGVIIYQIRVTNFEGTCIGVGYQANMILRTSESNVDLIGDNKLGWSWNLGTGVIRHNNKIVQEKYPSLAKMKEYQKYSGCATLPKAFYLYLDLDAEECKFVVNGFQFGVAFTGVKIIEEKIMDSKDPNIGPDVIEVPRHTHVMASVENEGSEVIMSLVYATTRETFDEKYSKMNPNFRPVKRLRDYETVDPDEPLSNDYETDADDTDPYISCDEEAIITEEERTEIKKKTNIIINNILSNYKNPDYRDEDIFDEDLMYYNK